MSWRRLRLCVRGVVVEDVCDELWVLLVFTRESGLCVWMLSSSEFRGFKSIVVFELHTPCNLWCWRWQIASTYVHLWCCPARYEMPHSVAYESSVRLPNQLAFAIFLVILLVNLAESWLLLSFTSLLLWRRKGQAASIQVRLHAR